MGCSAAASARAAGTPRSELRASTSGGLLVPAVATQSLKETLAGVLGQAFAKELAEHAEALCRPRKFLAELGHFMAELGHPALHVEHASEGAGGAWLGDPRREY